MNTIKSFVVILVLMILVAAWMPAGMASSQAAYPARSISAAGPWYVATSGNDANDCLAPSTPCATINAAIGKASPGDTVYVGEDTYTGEGDQVVLIDKDITLSGGWDTTYITQTQMSTLDAGGTQRRGIFVLSNTTVNIESFIIQNGSTSYGGGVLNLGNLTLTNSRVVGNKASEWGGGIYSEHDSTLVLTNTSVISNTSPSGGGVYNYGAMTIMNSAIDSNTGGGIHNNVTMMITNSSISSNRTNSAGAGVTNYGNLVINNTSISGNHATEKGGGIYNAFGKTYLNNSTVAYNSAILPNTNDCTDGFCEGGGVYVTYQDSFHIQNSIIAGNTALRMPDCGVWTYAIVSSSGYNLIGDTTGCTFQQGAGDLLNVNPRIWPILTGTPGYHQLVPGSPAINAGNPNGCTDHEGKPLNSDQRGVARVGRCDIGAYEYDPTMDPLHHISFPMALQNHTFCTDFFDDFSDPSSGWYTGEDSEGRAEYLNGEYNILLKPSNYFWVLRAPTCDRVNYSVEVDVRWAGETGASYGLIFGLQGDYERFYSFEVNADKQEFSLYRYDLSGWVEIVPVTTSTAIHAGKETNHLKASRSGDAITLEVNGTLLGTWSDGTITGASGSGLIVSSYSDLENAEASFDNFSVNGIGGSLNNSAAGTQFNQAQIYQPAFRTKNVNLDLYLQAFSHRLRR